MKRFMGIICGLTLLFSMGTIGLPSAVLADVYVSGSFNDWGTDDMMSDVSYGYFTNVIIESPGRYEFKVRNDDWSLSYPTSGNSWLYTDLPNQAVAIAFDATSFSDGWYPNTNIMYVTLMFPDLSWTAVGDWQGWNNADPDTAMTKISGSGDMFALTTVINTPGFYQYKAVITGTWDAIGADGRSVNADTLNFQTTQPGQEVTFYVRQGFGRIKVDVASVPEPVPEPSTMLLLGSGLIGLAGYGRKKFFKK